MQIEILDTTLREGEQTSGVSFSTSEKLNITRLVLCELNVPRIEIASARVSSGEFDAVRAVCFTNLEISLPLRGKIAQLY